MTLRLVGLSKSFGAQKVLKNLNLELPQGGRLALFGRNGAGKTTLLRIIAGLERPDAGKVFVAGYDVRKQADEARQNIGFLSHNSLLYPDLSAMENLVLYGKLHGVSDPKERSLELLEMVGLSKRRHDAARTFSRGMMQRLSLARALVHDPKVLLLDEPYTGLDAQACKVLDEFLEQMFGSHTMVMVDHERSRCLDFSTHILWLDPPIAQTAQDSYLHKTQDGSRPRKPKPVFCPRDELLAEQQAALLGFGGLGGTRGTCGTCDASDARDAGDTPDTGDASAACDASGTICAGGANDSSDARGTCDASDACDAGDTPDTRDAIGVCGANDSSDARAGDRGARR